MKRGVSIRGIAKRAGRDEMGAMTLPTHFIPHGGGPCFFLNPGAPPDPMWRPMQAYLEGLIARLPERPRAILIVSGHWEEAVPTVNSGSGQPLLYDYYGFPEHTYHLQWPAPAAPEVALKAKRLLDIAGFSAGEERARGWDHGVFVPMMVAVPDADIPLAQLSLRSDLDPAAHVAMGRALAPLREEGVLIVGSGMSFHNLRERGPHVTGRADAWDAALTDAVLDPDPERRAARLIAWEALPFARFAHPREEHLLPLMVALGAGGNGRATRDFSGHVLGWAVSGYRFD